MNDKKYLAVGGKGFCNCFKNLMSVLRLNEHSKTTVQRCGLVLEDKSIMFDHENDKTTDYIEHRGWRLKVLEADTDIPINFCEVFDRTHPKWTDSVNVDKRHVDHQYLKIPLSFRKKINDLIESRFKVRHELLEIVDKFYQEHGPYDSVHLRTFCPNRTYAMQSRYEYYLNTQKNKFIEAINSCQSDKVFVSYDYMPELNDVISKCNNKQIITFNKLNFNVPLYKERAVDFNEFLNDFIDLLLLSKGNQMILHELSTFSEVAWFYSNCNENVVII
jgi:hypothetical protein